MTIKGLIKLDDKMVSQPSHVVIEDIIDLTLPDATQRLQSLADGVRTRTQWLSGKGNRMHGTYFTDHNKEQLKEHRCAG